MSETENAATHPEEDSQKIQASEPAPVEAAANGNHKRKYEEDEEATEEEVPNKRTSTMIGEEVNTNPELPTGGDAPAQVLAPGQTPTPGFLNPTDPEQFTDYESIPGNMIGKLIGRAGESIKLIQAKTGARIQIDHKGPEEGKLVTITGKKDQVDAAKAEIHATMAPEVSEMLLCPQPIVGRIIGRQGETIKALQSASEAHIVVNQDFPEGVDRQITVSGRQEAVDRAARMIRELIAGEPGSAQAIIQKYGAGITRMTECPKAMVGRVIGKGGEVIKLLQKQHNVNIQIDQTIDPCRVSVTGNQMYVGKAVEHIRDIINGGPLPGQGGAYGGMGGMPGGYGGGFGGYGGGGYGAGYPQATPYGAAAGGYGGYGGFPGAGGFGGFGGGAAAGAGAGFPGYGGYGAGAAAGGGGDPYAGAYGSTGAAVGVGAPAGGSSGLWQELKDDSGNVYYYNTQTGVSQWQRPPDF